VLGGGFPEFSFNLIAGGPGAGKTTLAHQIMFAMARPERKAIYFSIVGEPPQGMAQIERRTGAAGEPFQHLQIGKHLRTRIEVERRNGARGGDFKRAAAIEDRRFGHVARARTPSRVPPRGETHGNFQSK